jgi:hypothetical protein
MDYTSKVAALIRNAEQDYTTGTTRIGKYVEFSQYENIERINAYINSKHISGEVDSMGREKPFFNIVNAARNIWYKATDIDRKDIRIKSTKASNVLFAFLATLKLQEWMRKTDFGQFLNEWGRALATYGSAVVKAVEVDKVLTLKVVNWSNFISDTINFEGSPKIEKFDFTESELLQNSAYDKTVVKSLIENAKTVRKTRDGTNRDNKDDFIEIYEVHGYFPDSWITSKEEDNDKYSQQMHVVSFYLNEKGEYDDYCLYKGVEAYDPYTVTHLIKEEGRVQSIGAVEHLFDAQWMQNHTVKAMKDQLDLSSKLIYQTADGNLLGQNVLSALETGDIIVHAPNAPLTMLNDMSTDIGALKTLSDMFYQQGQRTTGATDAIAGNTMPSGTPYSSVAIQLQASEGLFEIMVENKGLQLSKIIRERVIPVLKKQLNTTDEIAEVLSDQNIQFIDSIYIPNEAIRRYNKKVADKIFEGEIADPFDQAGAENEIRNELALLGNQRFIKPSDINDKTWDEVLKDIEWEIEVEITNEASDKRAVLQTLTTVLQTIVSNPAVLQDPNAKMLFGKILEETGTVSALQLNAAQTQPSQAPPSAAGMQAVGQLSANTK